MATKSSKRALSDLEAEEAPRNVKRRVELHPSTKQDLPYPSTSITARAVPFQQPVSLLTFSYDSSRTLEFTDSAMRYYVDPPRGADLRHGYDQWVKRPEEKGRLDGLLKAVLRIRDKMNSSGANGAQWLKDIGIVSWRGVMTKILTAPYEERDGWEMNVMQAGDTIYLEEYLSDERLAEKTNIAPRQRLQTYFGYSFESWCTSSRPGVGENIPGQPPGWGGDVDTNVQWCCVAKTKLGDTRMVIGGEVDCVRDTFSGKPDTFVELKTSMAIRGFQDEARFEKKLLKFYFQSFLLGVPEIVVGFRTPAGQLTTMQRFKTIELPRLVRGKAHAWDPSICLDWGRQFLTFIKSVVNAADSDHSDSASEASEEKVKVWRVKFTPRVGVSVDRLDKEAVKEVEAGEDRVGFFPRWYWDAIKERTDDLNPSVPDPGADNTPPQQKTSVLPSGWQI